MRPYVAMCLFCITYLVSVWKSFCQNLVSFYLWNVYRFLHLRPK